MGSGTRIRTGQRLEFRYLDREDRATKVDDTQINKETQTIFKEEEVSDFDIWMIRVKDDFKSETYAKYCAKSWTDAGFEVNFFDAVTPDTLHLGEHLDFHEKHKPAEKACFISQYLLWKKCYEEDRPILVLEHDAYLQNPEMIVYNPGLAMQYLGQHCMEANLYNPWWAKEMCNLAETIKNLRGPFGMIEHFLGIPSGTNKKRYGLLSRYGVPHTRFLGPGAPVKHVIIPELGTSLEHRRGKTSDRIDTDQADLFKIVPLRVALKA